MRSFLQSTFSLSRFTAIIIIAVIATVSFFTGRITIPTSIENTQVPLPKVSSHQVLNKSFSFPIKDLNGDTITNLTYTIQSADIQYDIILKGEQASAIRGKTFLVLNLKIINGSDKNVQINTRDYVRLSEGNSKDLLAADVHNDPVPIQPISTKYTRIGFTIDTNQRKILLHIGEIDGKKTLITLSIHS